MLPKALNQLPQKLSFQDSSLEAETTWTLPQR